jgi:hypothetical protein
MSRWIAPLPVWGVAASVACAPAGAVIQRAEDDAAFKAAVRQALPAGTAVGTFKSSMKQSHFHCQTVGNQLWCQHCELRDNGGARADWRVIVTSQGGSIADVEPSFLKSPVVVLRDTCE